MGNRWRRNRRRDAAGVYAAAKQRYDCIQPDGVCRVVDGGGRATKDGEKATLYDAQLYVLLASCENEEKAEQTLAEWRTIGEEMYILASNEQEHYGGQEFTVITYSYSSEENPYTAGASAFCVFKNYAVSVEITCRGEAAGSPKTLLADFLEHCHYAGE